jgi:hypothetical protein
MDEEKEDSAAVDLSPEEWPEVLHLLSKLAGSEVISELVATMLSPSGIAAFANPATALHEMDLKFGRLIEQRPDPSDTVVNEVLLAGLRELHSWIPQQLKESQAPGVEVGREVLEFLRSMRDGCGAEAVIRCIRDRTTSTLWTKGTLRGALSLLRVVGETLAGPFEARVGQVADGIGHAAERWYKPLLQVMLQLERMKRGDLVRPGPNSVGTLMGQCRSMWTPHGPLSVLDPHVRLIRNADGHREVELNLERCEVLFVNRPDGGSPPEILGPWTEAQLKDAAEQFLTRCWAMSLACVQFVVEELCDRMEQIGWSFPTDVETRS